MEFQDKVLKCIDCGQDFVFSAGEQFFFYEKQFKHEPKHCKSCKGKRSPALGGVPSTTLPKVETLTVCSNCVEFQDKVLKCIDCGQGFVFTAGEQLFFRDKQFKNEPKRCKDCKEKRLQALGAVHSTTVPKVETRLVCANCGKETTVPFKPTQGRPVLCRECFQQKETTAVSA
jgi:CxxC-x17-CxxC domain-containing protein